MNRRAQAGPVAMIIVLIFFVIVFAIFLANFNNTIITQGIATAELTGVEAFVLSNFNFWVLISMLLGTMAYLYLKQ